MSIGTMIKLGLALANLLQWITRRVDQGEWKRAGADEAMASAARQIAVNVGHAGKAYTDAEVMTDEELNRRLSEGI